MGHYLITGGCGFIGSPIAVSLRTHGHEVTCLDNFSRRGSEVIRGRVEQAGARVVHGDVRNPDDLHRLRGTYDALLECSAEPSVMAAASGDAARYVIDTNLGGAINCFEFARARGLAVLFLSTSRVYPYGAINALPHVEHATRFVIQGQHAGITAAGLTEDFPMRGPRTLYGATKLAAEELLLEYAAQYGVRTLVNRCGVVAGPWQMAKADQGIFTFWITEHHFGRPLRYIGFGGHGKQVRDLLHAEDLADLVALQLAQLERWDGSVYNVGGSAINLSLSEATGLAQEVTGRTVAIGQVADTRPGDVRWYVTDNAVVAARFGWRPQRAARRIFEETAEWLRAHERVLAPIFAPAA
jgi:CDP-paratose 2-epimerase